MVPVIDFKSASPFGFPGFAKEWPMNVGKTLFSQLMEFLPMHEFRRCVRRYRGHYRVKRFSCLDQFLAMAFSQLTYRKCLRDIEACLGAAKSKLYHMGFRSFTPIVYRSAQV